MKQSRKSSLLLQVALAVITFLVGTFVSLVAPEVVQKPIDLLGLENTLLLVVLICLLIIAISIAVVFRSVENGPATQKANSILRDLNDLRLQAGVTARYYEIDHVNDDPSILFQAATKVVKEAKGFIWVLESDIADPWDVARHDNQARNEYYSALREMAEQGRQYMRILQLPMPDGELVKLQEVLHNTRSIELEHFHWMADQHSKDANICIFKASIRRLLTFALIDGTYLILQIDELLPDGSRRMNGLLIVEDPGQKVTGPFRTFFEAMLFAGRQVLIPVRGDELPPITSDRK